MKYNRVKRTALAWELIERWRTVSDEMVIADVIHQMPTPGRRIIVSRALAGLGIQTVGELRSRMDDLAREPGVGGTTIKNIIDVIGIDPDYLVTAQSQYGYSPFGYPMDQLFERKT